MLQRMVAVYDTDRAVPHVEGDHVQADDILCAVLLHLGQTEIVELYERLPRWFG